MEEFHYVGNKITNDGRICSEIVSRINQAKNSNNTKNILVLFKNALQKLFI